MNGNRTKNERGFTLIELMATLVILALIIAIAVPAIGKLVSQADASADKSSISLMERAGEMAYIDNLKTDDAAPKNSKLPASITEKDVYMIPTLIEAGYLKLDDASKFNKYENYVKKIDKSGKFIYMGKGKDDGPTPDESGGDTYPVANPETDFEWDFATGEDVPNHTARMSIKHAELITMTASLEPLQMASRDAAEKPVVITRYIGTSKRVVVPQTIQGYPVTEIGNDAFTKSVPRENVPEGEPATNDLVGMGIESVVLPDTITRIGTSAFASNKLTTIKLPLSLEKIEMMAFGGNQLSHVVLPKNVKSIGMGAFLQSNLLSVDVPQSIERIDDMAFISMDLASAEGTPDIKHTAGFVLTGYAGTAAEAYAEKYDLEFVPKTPEPTETPDASQIVYASGYDAKTGKVNPVYAGSAITFNDGVGNEYFYWVLNDGSLQFFTQSEIDDFFNIEILSYTVYTFVSEDYTRMIHEPEYSAPAKPGGVIFGQ